MKQEKDGNSYHNYIAIFADRETADEWWRMISTPPSPFVTSIQRISPQFYVQSTADRDVNRFSSHSGLSGVEQLRQKVYTMLIKTSDRRIPITIPPITITDHISGRWCVS